MTFDKFRKDLMKFLDSSTVNLGRKSAQTRQKFMDIVDKKFDAFAQGLDDLTKSEDAVNKKVEDSGTNPLSKSVIMIKPKDTRKALNVGKGVHSMTASESMRADEQLGRSPYSPKSEKKG